jgi:hypothetical protein
VSGDDVHLIGEDAPYLGDINVLPRGFGSTLLCLAAGAADWPQWRGPRRDGFSQETGLLKQWPVEGPKLLWQLKDIGEGYETPAVAGPAGAEGLKHDFAAS